MQIRRLAFLTVILLVILVAGYMAGRSVEVGAGGGLAPGSAADPIVSESYLRQAVAEATAPLQAQLAALEARILELNRALAMLEGKAPPPLPSPGPVLTPQPRPQPQPAPALRRARVMVASANVRSGPDTTFSRVASLRQGAVVTILEERNNWFRIEYSPGQRGWILGRLVEIQ
jgi:uncharacterized protein YgiM (DUF1202 family)